MTDLQPQVMHVPVGMLETSCWVISLPGSDSCVVVDPGADVQKIRQACGGKHIAAILLTHGHFDHIGAVDALMEADTALYVHEKDAAMLADKQLNVSWMIGADIRVQAQPKPVREGDRIAAAGMSFDVLHTPGHTQGSCCFRAGTLLFTGDTMFRFGCGRTDLPGGDEGQMMQSLKRLQPMRKNHTIYPGHGV